MTVGHRLAVAAVALGTAAGSVVVAAVDAHCCVVGGWARCSEGRPIVRLQLHIY